MATSKQKELFDAFCDHLLKIVKDGGITVVAPDEDGEPVEKIVPIDASFAQCIRAFLKDFPPEEGTLWGEAGANEYFDKLPFTKVRSKKDAKHASNSPPGGPR